MCIPFSTIPPPTTGTRKAVQMLQILGICEFVVGLLKIFVLTDYSGFYDFFLVFILYMAWAQLNYCNCVIVVFYFLQNLLMIFIFFGRNVELSLPFFQPTRSGVLNLLFFIYYTVACYIAFLAYKEFKILQYDQMGGLISNQPQNGNFYQQQDQEQPGTQQQIQGRFAAFQGRGVAIG